jgi:protein gp37
MPQCFSRSEEIMGENSHISWTDHTFNPWMGCTKVSPGCKFCYAERDMDHRYHKVKWGPQGFRLRTSDSNWRKPKKWNKDTWYQCLDCGWRGSHKDTMPHAEWQREICPNCKGFNTELTRQRVFCASLADVFEYKEDQAHSMRAWRDELFTLIKDTPNLDWLILTKRPENVMPFRDDLCYPETGCPIFNDDDPMPDNVWIGTSVEDQKTADERIPHLLKIPAKVRFLSCEPLLDHIDLGFDIWFDEAYYEGKVEKPRDGIAKQYKDLIHWVIGGGESGPTARPTPPKAGYSLRDQCVWSGVRFHWKQWGEWNSEGVKVGRETAGRLLDGRTWDEFPAL